MDLGSNSFHLLVVEARMDGTFDVLSKEKEMLRLGDALGRDGSIGHELSTAAVEVVRRFRAIAESAGAGEIRAVATAALRDAEDGSRLAERIEAEAGVAVEVIGGLREAELIFRAVRAGVVLGPAPALALDLGGGSLEVMVGDRSGLSWAASLPLGVGRLTAELVRGDPPTAADLALVRRRVEEAFGPLRPRLAALAPAMLVGSSGTLCTLARMAHARATGVVRASVNRLTVGREPLGELHEALVSMAAADRRALAGMDARRVELVPAGSLLLLTVMDMVGLESMTASEWALREGMVLSAIGDHAGGDREGGVSIRVEQ